MGITLTTTDPLSQRGGGGGLNTFYRSQTFTLDCVVVKSQRKSTINMLATTKRRPVKQPTGHEHKMITRSKTVQHTTELR